MLKLKGTRYFCKLHKEFESFVDDSLIFILVDSGEEMDPEATFSPLQWSLGLEESIDWWNEKDLISIGCAISIGGRVLASLIADPKGDPALLYHDWAIPEGIKFYREELVEL